MIRTAQVMARVQAECPGFASVVHSMMSASDLPRPAAIVTPMKVEARPPTFYGQFAQIVGQEFGIFILVDRLQDGNGAVTTADQLDDLCESVRAALAGWAPDADHAPLAYGGGRLEQYQQQIGCWCEFFRTSNELRIA